MRVGTNFDICLILILTLIPVSGLGVDIYVPSLPAIHTYFDVHHSLIKLTITLYLLGFSLGQLFVGPLSDCYGRRVILKIGLILFCIFSFLCTLSTTITMLLFFRFLQGLAVTAPVVISKAIATDSYTGEALKKVSTYLVAAWSIGPIIAPAIGGYLQEYVGWRGGFYFLSFYSLLLFFLSNTYLPETNKFKKQLVLRNVFSDYKSICRNKIFLGCAACLAFGYSLIVIFNVVSPFLIQTELGYSPLQYGHLALLMGFGCFLGSIINRMIVLKVNQDKLILGALFLAFVCSVVLFLFSIAQVFNIYTVLLPVFGVLLSVGFTYPNCSSKCLSMFPTKAGSASAIMGVLTICGTSLFSGIASFVTTRNPIPLSIMYLSLISLFFIVFIYFVLGKEKIGI